VCVCYWNMLSAAKIISTFMKTLSLLLKLLHVDRHGEAILCVSAYFHCARTRNVIQY
jgi:hypothetical protein